MTLMLTSVACVARPRSSSPAAPTSSTARTPRAARWAPCPWTQIAAIVAVVDGRRPVSAVVELPHDAALARRDFEEVGRARRRFREIRPAGDARRRSRSSRRWRRSPQRRGSSPSSSPISAPISTLSPRLAGAGFHGAMLDTAHKGKGRLLDHYDVGALSEFVARCHALGLDAGLAGALESPDVPRLLVTGADVLGFRGALCAAMASAAPPSTPRADDADPRSDPRDPTRAQRATFAANVDWSLVSAAAISKPRARQRDRLRVSAAISSCRSRSAPMPSNTAIRSACASTSMWM